MISDRNPHDPAHALQRGADRICSLILATGYPDADIDRKIDLLRNWCAAQLPDRVELFDLIYGERFQRLREQFRSHSASTDRDFR